MLTFLFSTRMSFYMFLFILFLKIKYFYIHTVCIVSYNSIWNYISLGPYFCVCCSVYCFVIHHMLLYLFIFLNLAGTLFIIKISSAYYYIFLFASLHWFTFLYLLRIVSSMLLWNGSFVLHLLSLCYFFSSLCPYIFIHLLFHTLLFQMFCGLITLY